MAQNQSASRRSSAKARKRKSRKSMFPILIVITILIGIFICFQAFSFVYNMIASESVTESGEEAEKELSASEIIANAKSSSIGADIDGVIKEIDTEKDIFYIYSLKQKQTYSLNALPSTNCPANKFLSDYMPGDVVTFVFDEENNLTDLKPCTDGWEHTGMTGVTLATDVKLVKIGDKSFRYSDLTKVRKDGRILTLDDINEYDEMSMQGYDSIVYGITIDKGHGYLDVNNSNHIIEPFVSIDGNEKTEVVDSRVILTEGTHSLVFTGKNCEDFKEEVIISAGETAEIDLSGIQIKTGVLVVNVKDVEDYKLFLNNEQKYVGEPLLLDYNNYNLKIEAEGYVTHTEKIELTEERIELDIELEKEKPKGTVKITTSPGNAKIYVNDEFIGISPQTKTVEYGEYKITVKLDDYLDEVSTVKVDSENVICNYDLTPIISHYVDTTVQPVETEIESTTDSADKVIVEETVVVLEE